MKLSVHTESWEALIPFRISRAVWNTFDAIVCEIGKDGRIGRGEALGVSYLGETNDSMLDDVKAARKAIEGGISREALLDAMPHGGARNAVDAALWDLEAKLTGRTAWEMAGVPCEPIETVFTIGLEAEPEQMGAKAAAAKDFTLFKVKLNDDRPVERIAAIRDARGDARLVVDVNEGWDFEQLKEFAPELQRLGVSMIEQPLERGADDELENYEAPLPLCGDESCLHLGELEQAGRRYQMINIKLDKCGGLTHGLSLARAAKDKGLGVMVGCMGGTSLSMAPSHVLAQICDFVDIDGPLLLKNDHLGGLVFERGYASLPDGPFWGLP